MGDERSTEACMMISDVYAGMIVAVKLDGNWFRAMVRRLKGESHIKVFLYDYGSIQTVLISNLRNLPNEFMQLPAQGILVRLAGIQSSESSNGDKLRQLIIEVYKRDSYLLARAEHQYDEDTLHVWLADIEGNIINQIIENQDYIASN